MTTDETIAGHGVTEACSTRCSPSAAAIGNTTVGIPAPSAEGARLTEPAVPLKTNNSFPLLRLRSATDLPNAALADGKPLGARMPQAAAIFDVDGTLVDSVDLHAGACDASPMAPAT